MFWIYFGLDFSTLFPNITNKKTKEKEKYVRRNLHESHLFPLFTLFFCVKIVDDENLRK